MGKESKLIRGAANSALRFWEPVRLIYNLILIAGLFAFTLGQGWLVIRAQFVDLVFCAVAANVLFTAAYIPDLLLGVSDYNGTLKYVRWLLFLLGLLLSLFLELAVLAFLF